MLVSPSPTSASKVSMRKVPSFLSPCESSRTTLFHRRNSIMLNCSILGTSSWWNTHRCGTGGPCWFRASAQDSDRRANPGGGKAHQRVAFLPRDGNRRAARERDEREVSKPSSPARWCWSSSSFRRSRDLLDFLVSRIR